MASGCFLSADIGSIRCKPVPLNHQSAAMNAVYQINNIPEGSNVTQGFGPISYTDTFKAAYPLDETIDQIVTDIFTVPRWIDRLMYVRNAIVRPFGLRADDKTDVKGSSHYDIGSRAMYFTVCKRTENEIVVEETDKHLNFRISVLKNTKESSVYVTTILYFNNTIGRLYFFFVKPFHKMIIKSCLKRAVNVGQQRASTSTVNRAI